jgi:DNA-directed RNA polymerase specialized sigma24 family protein
VLHKFNGLTYAEIAATEGISIKTVENHMIKAIKILRSHLSKNK